MRKALIIFVLVGLIVNVYSQNKLPYPIIFVHGLAGSENTFGETLEYLRDHDNLGEINVFDIVLNADDNTETSLMFEDVKWADFIFDDTEIKLGRRNFVSSISDYVHEWTDSNLFALNFKEENIDGAHSFFGDHFDQSNESAIFKQGYALNKMIQEVLDYTGAEKVILVGHSMGGLCIREYLQRTDESNVHVNWIDPTTENGHKVARVITVGTPHLGANTSLDPTKSELPNALGITEANRDLLYEYNNYTFCEGYPQGIYLFGGNENCIKGEGGLFGNSTFKNVDINCNGSETDDIIGVNESPESFSYNPEMPLPTNIKYTYITSIWIGWDVGLIGDGAVSIDRQWLYDENNNPVPLGITDTLLTNVFHTSIPKEPSTVIRGMDEPNSFSLAYGLNLNQKTIGYITYQQDGISLDEDVFRLRCEENSTIAFVYNGEESGVNIIEFYDLNENLILSKDIINSIDTTFVTVPATDNEIYVKLIGNATSTSWENPYKIHSYPVDITNNPINNYITASIFPNPASGLVTIKVSDKQLCKLSIYNNNAAKVFETEINQNKEFDFSFLPNGIYTIKFDLDNESISKKLVIIN
ncbi:MAG: alpha/beta fold hydrolase [Bacteroidales bacterium]|nr:alpha/beta fold hydrolase [Bacteroidales bacterium]MDY0141398.1 alpha/beta fold hydrolase [Bacteroidales bacterium]